MNIETYANSMIYFFIGLFLVLIVMGIVCFVQKIRGRSVKHWWIILYSIGYSIFAMYNTFIPFIAYDDPADPNYHIFKGWELRDFIVNDIKMLAIWLLIGVLIYGFFNRKADQTEP